MRGRIDGFDWNRARAFLVAAETGSFASAARRLGVAQPTIGRQIAALERELGVTLFHRAGHGASLTEAGVELIEPLRAMADAAHEVALAATGAAGALEGPVRLTASEMICAHLLPPVIRRIRLAHPGISLEIIATQEVRDLRRGDADLAIRNVAPADPELVARRLPDGEGGLYASPAYLDALGPLRGIEDLARVDLLAFDTGPSMSDFLRRLGVSGAPAPTRIACANHQVLWAMCRAGLGATVNMTSIGDADPGVRRVPVDLPRIPVPMWLVSHRALRTSRRLRAVADALIEALDQRGESEQTTGA